MQTIMKLTTLLALLLLVTAGCSNTVTRTYPLETDTFISSEDSANHATLAYLKISKSASVEERGIVRLPSKNEDVEKALEQSLAEDLIYFFFLPFEIIARILNCNQEIVSAANLETAYLEFDVSAGTVLTNQIELGLLTKAWWQSVSWTQAHPFSSTRGAWALPGGDIDPSFTPVPNTINGSVVSFDITNYFASLMGSGGTMAHYGFLLKAINSSLAGVQLHSVQGLGTRPRVRATFKATCTTQGYGLYQSVFELGENGAALTEKLQ